MVKIRTRKRRSTQLPATAGANLVSARQLNGKELSYNNLLDLDAALAIVRSLPGASAVVIKHNNPCGAATANDLATAMRNALDGDPVSAFGGIVGLNRPLDAATAEVLAEPDRFIEAIVAPEFEPAGLEILQTKPKWKANVRLLQVGSLAAAGRRMAISSDRRRVFDARGRCGGRSRVGMAHGHNHPTR